MLHLAHPPGWEPERRYAIETVFGELLGLETTVEVARRDDVEVTLAGESGRLLLEDGLFSRPEGERLTPATLPATPFGELRGVPVLYGPADLLGSAFFCLTRYEELVVPVRDERGRFPASASVLARAGLLERPLVDEWAELLWQDIQAVWPRLERRAPRFELLPSHDVDWPVAPERTPLQIGRRAAADLLRHDPGAALARLRSRNPFDTFDWLMDASEGRGLQSAFYMIVDGPAPELDCGYSIDEPSIRALIRRIHERGHELGLHTSYDTFRDPERVRRERERLARVCAEEGVEQKRWGGRQHFLRWENPTTWQAWQDAGLDYDTSLGFHDRVGFRCGTCREFRVFNLETRQRLELRERPLVAMEVALLDRQGLAGEAAAERLRALKEQCRRFGGSFTLLWHNSRLLSPRERRLYLGALDA